MTKWIAIIAGAIVALYLIVAGINYIWGGTSHEGRVIQPGEFTVTVE